MINVFLTTVGRKQEINVFLTTVDRKQKINDPCNVLDYS